MVSVAHIITSLSVGGAERALLNLLSAGLAKAHRNIVVGLGKEDTIATAIQRAGVPVATLGINPRSPMPNALVRLGGLIRGFRPEVIQGWMYHGNLAASAARFLAGSNSQVFWNVRHSLYSLQYEKRQMRWMIRIGRRFSGSAGLIIYNSDVSREQHEDIGFCRDNGIVIPNGIDTRVFSPCAKARLNMRGRLRIPEDAIVVGHVARFHPMKNHFGFIRAVSALALRHPDLHVVLVGRGVQTDNDALSRSVPTVLQSRFHLLGERHDVSDIMRSFDIFCLSSIWGEGYPNVLGEAMASGVPCVAADVGDSAAVVGDAGMIVPRNDDAALMVALERLVYLDISARRALGLAARERIEENWSLASITRRYIELYDAA